MGRVSSECFIRFSTPPDCRREKPIPLQQDPLRILGSYPNRRLSGSQPSQHRHSEFRSRDIDRCLIPAQWGLARVGRGTGCSLSNHPAFSSGVAHEEGIPGLMRDKRDSGRAWHGCQLLEFVFNEVTLTSVCPGAGLASSLALPTCEAIPVHEKPRTR